MTTKRAVTRYRSPLAQRTSIAFLEALGARVERAAGSEIEVEPLLGTAADPVVALPAPPGPAAQAA